MTVRLNDSDLHNIDGIMLSLSSQSYKRLDWRRVIMARATDAACLPTLTPLTYDPALGGSVALELVESERQCKWPNKYFRKHFCNIFISTQHSTGISKLHVREMYHI